MHHLLKVDKPKTDHKNSSTFYCICHFVIQSHLHLIERSSRRKSKLKHKVPI